MTTTAQWNAHDYSRHSSEQQKWAHELIDKLNLSGTEHLLDVGCGDGKVTAAIARLLPRGRAVGVDVSPDMIAFARMHFPIDNLSFMQMDASSLNFEGRFDVVFSNAAIHWITDHRPVLRGIARSLKPGGRVLLQMGGRGCASEMVAAMTEVTRRPEWSEFFQSFLFPYGFYSPDDYRQWMPEAGLTVERAELIEKDMTHSSIEAFAGWIRTTWMPWTHSVPESRRDSFIAQAVKYYLSQHPRDDQGRVHVKMVRLEVSAQR